MKKLAEKLAGDVTGRNKWLAKHLNIEIGAWPSPVKVATERDSN